MAYSMASINPKGLSNFRRWMRQYQATYGMAPPQNLVSSYLQGEIGANLDRSHQNLQLRTQREQFDKSLAAQKLASDRTYAMQQRQYKDQQDADKWSGYGQAIGLGLKVVDAFDLGDPIKDLAGDAFDWISSLF